MGEMVHCRKEERPQSTRKRKLSLKEEAERGPSRQVSRKEVSQGAYPITPGGAEDEAPPPETLQEIAYLFVCFPLPMFV